MFVPLDNHAANIVRVMREVTKDPHQWFGVADWLLLAASISSVEVDSFKHDPGSYMCGAAFEYEDAQAELRKIFVERPSSRCRSCGYTGTLILALTTSGDTPAWCATRVDIV